MREDGLKKYVAELKKRGLVHPPNPEAVRVYNESMKKLLPEIEADLKAQQRSAHYARIGCPDPHKALPATALRSHYMSKEG